MNSELIIYNQAGVRWFVLLEDGRPAEFLTDDADSAMQLQDILLGQITRLNPALDSVFVNIGDEHDAWLPLHEAPAGSKPGQRILVQIRRLTDAGKGHKITTRIQLPGPFAVYRPEGAPRRRSKLQAFPPEQAEQLYAQDLSRLAALWRQLRADSELGPAPRHLLVLGDPLQQALTNFITPDLQRIRVEGSELFQSVYDRVNQLMPPYLPLLALHRPDDGYGLSAIHNLTDLDEVIHRRKVWLDNGGFLIIDPTEALTVIDVNSGKDVRGQNNSDLRWRTNSLAAAEVARQLRLRNITGIVVIDFLNLENDTRRADLLAELKTSLARDRARCKVYGFTGLGLLELVRAAR